MSTSQLIILWLAITGTGLIVGAANLFDALAVWRWQRRYHVNGARRLLAFGHIRTAALRALEIIAAFLLGILGALPGWVPSWFTVVLLFLIVTGVCLASIADFRDRRKIASAHE